jgi:hypothetical protein
VASRAGVRRLPLALAALALVVPLALSLTQLASSASEDRQFADLERRGVAYLGPLVRLVSATSDAQSAAVAGRSPDREAIEAAVQQVDEVEALHGATLGTTVRWDALKDRLLTTTGETSTGAQAYLRYTQVTDLELALVSALGDSSKLILDPSLDSYYVMDTVLLRIPEAVVDAGRLSDLAVLNEAGPRADAIPDQYGIEVLRADLLRNSGVIEDNLRKSLAATDSRELGPGLVRQMDRLRDALTEMAPPSDAVGATAESRPPSREASARNLVRDYSLTLHAAALIELDKLLITRSSPVTSRLLLLGAGSVLSVLLALGLGWWGLRARPGTPSDAGAGAQAAEANGRASGTGHQQESARREHLIRAGASQGGPRDGS